MVARAYPDPYYRQWVTETWDAAVRRAAPEGRDIDPVEYKVTCKSGEERVVEISGITLGEEFLATFIDLTERKRAEETLKVEKQRLEKASAAGNVALWDWDIVSGVLEWSSAIDPMLGFGKDKFPRTIEAWGKAMHPDDAARVAKALDRHHRGEAPYEIDYRVRRMDGSYIWWRVIGVAERDAAGKAVRMSGSCVDITERKRAEEALRESESRFRQLAESLPQLVWTCQPDGPCDYLNRQWVEFTGVPEAQQHGFGWLEQLHPDDRAPTVAAWEATVASGSDFRAEFRIRRHDGEYRWFDAQAVRLRDAGGHTVKWFGANTDMTERKRAEAEIRKLNAELEQRVRERTAELEAANKELEAFSYSVSHDLRAPLRGIDGFSRILLERCSAQLDDEGKDSLQRVRAAAQRMGELIDDLLTLSRATRAELRRTTVDLTALAGEITAELERAEPARKVHWMIAPGLTATGDRQLLRVVLDNLLNNALKFTSRQAEARIEFGAMESGKGCAFFVRDNGVGFDMTYAGKLFGAFQRLHATADFPGTGIGLATVQRIIHRHGGRVWAESEVNHGATFYFTLPATSQQP